MFRSLLGCQALKTASILRCGEKLCSSATLSVQRFPSTSAKGSLISKRSMSSTSNRDLFYDDIIKLSSKKEITLIDVREPAEIQETGKLPGSTHIPLGDVPSALSMDEEAFSKKYGIQKPGPDDPLVFSCRSGKRSVAALEKALALGFSKSRHYAGGWLDWEKNTKP